MALNSQIISALENIFSKDSLYLDPGDCWPYGYDNSKMHTLPDAVVLPQSHQQVVDCVAVCNQHNISLTTRGRGTGTTGASVPAAGGIVLSTEHMDQIIEFDRGNRSVRVQPGLTNQTLQNFLADKGFFWPPDPSSAEFCSVGGNLACNAAGPRAIKYGTTRENTLQLKAVTGAGNTIIAGSRTSKGVVGLDLARLLIGSEGTLAIITEAELKIHPTPCTKNTLRVLYRSHRGACEAIQNMLAQPHLPCAIEFMDHHAIQLIQKHGNISLPDHVGAMLMVEVDGDPDSINVSVRSVEQALVNDDQLEIRHAATAEETTQLWQARKALSPILRTMATDKINEDVVVPVPRLSELIDALDALSEKFQLPIVNFGHAGNGNLHVNIMYNAENEQQNTNALACLNEIFAEVLRLDGTISGEHGIGILKRNYVRKELSENELQLMRQIKLQFDPNQILNPNKNIPD